MARQVQDIMTRQVHTVRGDAAIVDVARVMRDQKIGDVLVTNTDGTLLGIVTDRDIVVRAVAAGKPVDKLKVADIVTDQLVSVSPTSTVDEAIKVMRTHAVRRVPVVQDGKPTGILTIGDLARHQDPRSALAQISSAAANN
ncbi:MAG: CBS domain-containing protein [Deltaproteobacteria bacterium]|nr:CBS domain-containing protein [Deltaproteobacteria bacterium]MCW5801652.1 CBS domain-containing protein [Deltaproteobacteria bacterium]